MKKNSNKKIDEHLASQLLGKLNVGVLVIAISDGRILYANDIVTHHFGNDQSKVIGHNYEDIFFPEFFPVYDEMRNKCDDKKEHTIAYYWSEHFVWVQVSCKSIDWDDKDDAILMTTARIPDTEKIQHAYAQIAYIDTLTGLPNGKKLEKDISELADFVKVALLYFEIERFDDINDLFGFEAGDKLFVSIKNWLLGSETKAARFYRIENGFVLLGKAVSIEDADYRSQQIIKRFKKPWTIEAGGSEYTIFCSVKIGVVFEKYVKDEMRNLILRTMRLPSNDKNYILYDEKTDKEVRDLLGKRQILINCIKNNMSGFQVCYQPIVEAGSHRWVGAEALCRWTTPQGISVPPLVFVHMAEQMGIVEKIDDWVRATAMSDCMEIGLNEKDFFLDVNFSPTQSINDEFINTLLDSVKSTGYPLSQLNLEVTESTKLQFNQTNIDGLKKLCSKGIVLSLDDFGTGYSSIENLIKIPASVLKTEKMFIDNVEKDEYKQYLYKLLVQLANHLDIKIITEGVETKSQMKLVEEFGVDYIQGFYFSKPLLKKDFSKEVHRFKDK